MTTNAADRGAVAGSEPGPKQVKLGEHRLTSPRTMFVHSKLDDAGLTLAEYRLAGTISRRDSGKNGCWASLETMCETTGLCMSTVKKALRGLLQRGIISRESRPGHTSVLRLQPPEKLPTGLKNNPGKKRPATRVRKYPPPGLENTPQRISPEGNPKKDCAAAGVASSFCSKQEPNAESDAQGGKNVSGTVSAAVATPPSSACSPGERDPVQAFLDAWAESYKKAKGRPYFCRPKDQSKDRAAAADLLKHAGQSPEQLLAIAKRAWKHPAGFYCKKASSILGFVNDFNKICTELDALNKPTPSVFVNRAPFPMVGRGNL